VYGAVSVVPCKVCGIPMVRKLKSPSLIVKETIDSGVMHRRVEQLANVGDLMQERIEDHEKKMTEDWGNRVKTGETNED
jgi:hypothetical protein